MNGEPALPVDVEIGRHGPLTVVAEASGNVVLVLDVGQAGSRRVIRRIAVTDVGRLVDDLLTARTAARLAAIGPALDALSKEQP